MQTQRKSFKHKLITFSKNKIMDWSFKISLQNRKLMAMFLKEFSLEQLNKIPNGFNNNIIWNIAHIVATQQQLVYGLSGLTLLISNDFLEKYRKGSKPIGDVTKEEIFELKNLMFSTLEKTQEDYNNNIFKNFKPYTTSTNNTITNIKDAIEFNNFHEGIHLGYILALKKSL